MTDFTPATGDPKGDMLLERAERREFFRTALGAGAIAVAGAAAVAVGSGALAQATAETDYLNIALNLQYLEAQFFSYAVNGAGLPAAQTAPGSASTTTLGTLSPGRAATFTDPLVAQYAREIAAEKAAQVAFMRTTLGTVAIAQPAIDISVSATSAFTIFGRAANIATNSSGAIDKAAGTFDPYASDANFLLGAFFLEDICVSAYRALIGSFTTKSYIDGLAGLIAASAYHSSLIRTVLYTKGAVTGSTLRAQAGQVSDTRDLLDGTVEDDQGIAPVTVANSQFATLNGLTASNVVPAGVDGVTFGRSFLNVLNIVYLNSLAVTKGGFYPNGLNGTYATSAAN